MPTVLPVSSVMAATAVDRAGGTTTTRRDAPAPPKARLTPRRTKPTGHLPTRRDFFRMGLLTAAGGMLAAFAGASMAFLWPSLRGGFGARLSIGSAETVSEEIAKGNGHFAYPAGRLYVVEYDPSLDPEGQYADITDDTGFMALYHRCVHLGCRVPWCDSSRWFECPCHGSRYNLWGEYQFGPAPRGLDRFAVTVEQGEVIVDTSTIVTGPARQGGALNQSPEGPHCV